MTGKPDTRIEALTQKHATLDRFVSTLAAQVANVDNRLAADKLKKIIDRFDELELTVVELYGYYQAIFDELARIRARHRELVERFESYARDGVYVDADELADGIQVPSRGLPVAGGAAALNDDELDKIALGLDGRCAHGVEGRALYARRYRPCAMCEIDRDRLDKIALGLES